jgi:antitoxin (DNA-binding transcriptional repressor) of toxin-antitoxin stability system
MRFFSTKDLRNRPGRFRRSLRDGDVVLTANGKPFALVVGVEEDEVEEMAALLRRARAQQAVSRMRRRAAARGEGISEEEIEAEIRASRAERPVVV